MPQKNDLHKPLKPHNSGLINPSKISSTLKSPFPRAELLPMSRRLLIAQAVVAALFCCTQGVYAQNLGQSPSILVSVSGDPADGRPDRTSQPIGRYAPPPKSEQPNPQSLQLRLPEAKIDLSKGKRGAIDSIAFEPWAPARGSLGVKVEVTW